MNPEALYSASALSLWAEHNGRRRGISPEMAVRLSKVFGGSAESWLVQQAQYDLALKCAGNLRW
jgi:hypothetical protein